MATTTSSNLKTRAMAWLPTSPATLFVLDGISGESGVKSNYFLSDDGISCNDHEAGALMQMLKAHEEYFSNNNGPSFQKKSQSWTSLRALSKAYRLALNECLRGWEQAVEDNKDDSDDAANNDKMSLELLQVAVPVIHLAEIFLLLPAADASVGHYKKITSIPGALTADTVRYLRLHHMADVYASVDDPAAVDEVLNSLQPEQVGEGILYWKLIKTMVLRGCLDDAWALLSRHSLCRTCFDDTLDDYHTAARKQDRQGFLSLRALLLSAPLPGGRTSDYDAVWGDGIEIDEEDETVGEKVMLEGIPVSAYKLWETGNRSDGDSDYPIIFQPHAAMKMHQNWKHYVRELQTVRVLKRRVPQLHSIITIMSGDLTQVSFDSWGEVLCAELLYVRPDIRPHDISSRAEQFMTKFGPADNPFNSVVTSIMDGNAGRAIRTMQDLGGRYGAALPTTMTALLCGLLREANVLPVDEEETESLQTELLLSASFAIVSSLAVTKADIGVRLSTRLLLPYCKLGCDLRIVATIAETLEHHVPQSDAEARDLIEYCKTLLKQKSVRVLDGCVNLCLCRYHQYLADQRPGGAMHWLLQGLELEAVVFANDDVEDDDGDDDDEMGGTTSSSKWERLAAASTCYRLLVTWCVTTSQSLLNLLVGDPCDDALVCETAHEMISSVGENDAKEIPEVATLKLLFEMSQAFTEKQDTVVARKIVESLEENANDDGIVGCLAHPSMHWNILRLALLILQSDEQSLLSSFESSFDVHGIKTLLTRFELSFVARAGKKHDAAMVKLEKEMRLAFGKGLMRAIVAENKRRKPKREAKKNPLQSARSMHLNRLSVADQEKVVSMMLDS